MVAEELLEAQAGVTYEAHPLYESKIACPIPGCEGVLRDGWMIRRHFQDIHPLNRVIVPKEGLFPRCERCAMQVNPAFPCHIRTKEYQVGVERRANVNQRWHRH